MFLKFQCRHFFLRRLKEKGILEELQVFLRTKMVEKLQGTCLRSTRKNSALTTRDHAVNSIVCDYLKRSQMHYTLSVFASECPSFQLLSNLDDDLMKENIYAALEIESLSTKVGVLPDSKEKCFLREIVDACSILCSKKFQNRHSQHSNHREASKLFINAQSQTEIQKVSSTKAAQTRVTSNTATQTESNTNGNEDEMTKLRSQLEASQTALKSCQLQLQDSRQTIENIVSSKLRFSYESPASVELLKKTPNHTTNQGGYDQRIRESRRFLTNLDNHLEHLDEKYLCLSARGNTSKHPVFRRS